MTNHPQLLGHRLLKGKLTFCYFLQANIARAK